jgi:hypothetical protein
MQELPARRRPGATRLAVIAALGLAAAACGPGHARPADRPSPHVTPMIGGPARVPQPVLGTGDGATGTALQSGPRWRAARPAGISLKRSTWPARSG